MGSEDDEDRARPDPEPAPWTGSHQEAQRWLAKELGPERAADGDLVDALATLLDAKPARGLLDAHWNGALVLACEIASDVRDDDNVLDEASEILARLRRERVTSTRRSVLSWKDVFNSFELSTLQEAARRAIHAGYTRVAWRGRVYAIALKDGAWETTDEGSVEERMMG